MGAFVRLESKIVNDKFTQYLYDCYDIQDKEKTVTDVPIPSKEDMDAVMNSNWNIILVCGKSGSGKSTILRNMGGITEIEYDNDKAVISQFPTLTEEEACDLLCGVGLASVPTWLRKPSELSNGEKARLDLCKALYVAKNASTAIIDEFTSVVNRDVAKSMSFALQRYVRQKGLKVIIASCHFDIIEWLQPDYVFNLNHREEDGSVEMERMEYSDSTDYTANQTVKESDVLTERKELWI